MGVVLICVYRGVEEINPCSSVTDAISLAVNRKHFECWERFVITRDREQVFPLPFGQQSPLCWGQEWDARANSVTSLTREEAEALVEASDHMRRRSIGRYGRYRQGYPAIAEKHKRRADVLKALCERLKPLAEAKG
jgi:hypothetical protein